MQSLHNVYLGFMQNICQNYAKIEQFYAVFIHFKLFYAMFCIDFCEVFCVVFMQGSSNVYAHLCCLCRFYPETPNFI
jgi:hypothetical protein